MPEKIQESLKVALQVLLPFAVLLTSMFITRQILLININKILVITEIGLFATACAVNLYQFIKISLLMCVPPACLRQTCQILKWLVLLFAVISGGYVFLSISWLLAYGQQQLIESLDMLYNIIENCLAVYGIIFGFFAGRFTKRHRSEPIEVPNCKSDP